MTRDEFLAAWREHRERYLLQRFEGDSRLGAKLATVGREANQFWTKHKPYLLTVNVEKFFERVLRAHKEATKL